MAGGVFLRAPNVEDIERPPVGLVAPAAQHVGVDPADAAEVARLIRATAKHRTDAADRLGALLISIDLSILGTDSEGYRLYVDGVRKEYAHVPDPLWQTGRAAVLERLLNADPLYRDAEFRGRFEAQARRNMEDELRSLAAG